MFHILGFIFFFLLIIIIVGLIILFKIVGTVFRLGRRMKGTDNASSHRPYTHSEDTGSESKPSPAPSRKKVFGDDEGEYVDYEEIKEK